MPSFIVDPLLVTAPSQNADAADIGRWLGAIDRWLQEVESSPFPWRHLLECTGELMLLRRFPTFDHLRSAQRLSRVDVNVGLLLRRISAFFQSKDHDLLRLTATQCAVVEEDQPSILPVEILARNEAEVQPPMVNALLCVACDRAAGMKFAASAHIVTLPFSTSERTVSIKGTIALEKLIRICAAVVLNQADEINVDLRPVRLGPAADSPQLRRHGDGARAWRLTITKKGVGWRLHYWHIPPREPVQKERIEFACVLRKQDPVRMPDAG